MGYRRGHRRILVAMLLAVSIAGGALTWKFRQRPMELTAPTNAPDNGEPKDNRYPVLELPSSKFLNTTSAARYVGGEACRACHEDAFNAYRKTGMGRSLALLNPDHEPPDAVFDHPKSGRRYRVYRQEGRLRHQEFLLARPGVPEVVMADYAIPYVIGSGRHSRSYLLEIDGFLVESPLTWYTSQKAWGMSPGYDLPVHSGFSRPIDEGCVNCHSGNSRAIGKSLQRIEISETWISCERCHGPGSLHVDRWSNGSPAAPADDDVDVTIVNQRHLDRELSESICSQCHLRATASIIARGRAMPDFRPGLPLERFRVDYRLDEDPSSMTVVGHVEQIRLSRCYQRSKLTCTTCHDPHLPPQQVERANYYRDKCLDCHAEEKCTVDPSVRQQRSADNNCIVCHMPTSDTEIPHLAFTHHRIGIHSAVQTAEPVRRGTSELAALADLSAYQLVDRQRMLGLAYIQTAKEEPDAVRRNLFESRAFQQLSEAWQAGLRDVDVAATLGWQSGRLGHDPTEFIQYSMSHPEVAGMARVNSLLVSAAWLGGRGEYAQAIAAVREVTTLRRVASDWKLLGILEQRAANPSAAQAALDTAAEIEGLRPAAQLQAKRIP